MLHPSAGSQVGGSTPQYPPAMAETSAQERAPPRGRRQKQQSANTSPECRARAGGPAVVAGGGRGGDGPLPDPGNAETHRSTAHSMTHGQTHPHPPLPSSWALMVSMSEVPPKATMRSVRHVGSSSHRPGASVRADGVGAGREGGRRGGRCSGSGSGGTGHRESQVSPHRTQAVKASPAQAGRQLLLTDVLLHVKLPPAAVAPRLRHVT